MTSTARNALIVVALAAAVYLLPGGGSGANLVSAVLGTLITASFAFFGYRLYREHRVDLFSLGDQHRGLLYGAGATAVWAMAARPRLFASGAPGVLLWCAAIGGASYALVVVFRRYRDSSY